MNPSPALLDDLWDRACDAAQARLYKIDTDEMAEAWKRVDLIALTNAYNAGRTIEMHKVFTQAVWAYLEDEEMAERQTPPEPERLAFLEKQAD